MTREATSDVLRLLAQATRAGALTWETLDRYGNGFRSRVGGRSYEIRWLTWYNEEGISIDRQCLSVSSSGWRLTFAWGSDGMDWAVRLLGDISEEYQKHFRTIASQADDFIRGLGARNIGAGPMSDNKGLSEIMLDVVSLLLRATRAGKLQWNRSLEPLEREVYLAKSGERPLMIELLRPAVDEDATAEALVARVSIDQATLYFASGTRGLDLVREMLALCQPDWAERLQSEREALEAERRFLLSINPA